VSTSEPSDAPLLAVRGVKTYYGSIIALRGVDLEVNEGEIVALIGANGAGKSTLMMTICGKPQAREGRVVFGGRDITKLPTHEIARLRIAQAPEGRRIFARMTVRENLQMGAVADGEAHVAEDLDRVFALFPRIKDRLDQRGGTLSGGEQQMLAIARALMGRPRLLLLDEPSLGLAPLIAQQIFEAIRDLNVRERLTVFLVEQDAFHALKLAHRGYVMVNGLITLSGTGRELLQRPEIRAAYLEGGRRGTSRMDVHINEAGHYRQVSSVNYFFCCTAQLSDRNNFAIADAHISIVPGVARAIDDLPAGDQYIEHGGVEATIFTDYVSEPVR